MLTALRRASAVALLAILAACGRPPPSDDALTRTFIAHRAQFEALRADLCRLKYDATIMRDPPWAQPQMPPKTEARYQAQLAAIGALGVHYVRGCQVFIEMWTSGAGRVTSYKKIRFGPPLYRVIPVADGKDLSAYLDKRVADAAFEKNIAGDWWIELDHWR